MCGEAQRVKEFQLDTAVRALLWVLRAYWCISRAGTCREQYVARSCYMSSILNQLSDLSSTSASTRISEFRVQLSAGGRQRVDNHAGELTVALQAAHREGSSLLRLPSVEWLRESMTMRFSLTPSSPGPAP